jgi:two-component system CheB/CheR fusion protein
LKSETIDLVPIVHQAVEASAPLMAAAKHDLALDVDEGPRWVLGDTARLEQVIVNLLTNAAKYTREGGRIRLSLGREGGELVIRVRDSGVGIPARMLPRVFELFEQAHPTIDRARGGLGLTLVKQLVEMHGGTVSVASEGEGRGSEFVVRLPSACAPGPMEEERGAVPAARTRRVLVVDDNRDHALELGLLLEQEGHVTALAHDGASALDVARRFVPDVVVLDIGLPGMDGYEVARRLRRLDGAGHLKIVVLSGYGQDDDLRRSREAGCDLHLVKPVDQRALLAHIASEARRGG